MQTPTPNPLKGIALMILAMACFSVMNVGVRHAATSMHTTQLVFLRNATSLVLILLWIFLRYGRNSKPYFHTSRISGHFWRSGLGFCAMEIWFYSLSILPLSLATALSFTTPVFATIFAIWILKEKAGWRRWCAILVSFIGVLIILRPGTGSLEISAGIVLISSSIMALAGIVVKSLTKTEPAETIVFYMAICMTPLSAIPGIYNWGPLNWTQCLDVLVVAVFSTAAHLLIARAYLHADMVVLLPFDFMRLLFTAVLAYFFFNETMDGYTALGASIIMAASVYIAHREAVRRRKKLLEAKEIAMEELG